MVPAINGILGFSVTGRFATIRAHFVLLVVATLLPGAIFTGFLLWQEASDRVVRQESLLLDFAQSVAQAVEQEITNAATALETLRHAEPLVRGDLVAFEDLAKRVLAQHPDWVTIVLARASDGQQVVNLAAEPGKPLPSIAHYNVFRAVVQTRQTAVSELIFGQVATTYLIAVQSPVFIQGELRYVIGMSLPATKFYTLLKRQAFPDGWVAGLIDGQDKLVTRSNGHEDAVGKPASRLWKSAPEDKVFRISGTTGVQVLALSPVGRTTWRVGMAVQESAFNDLTLRSLRWHSALAVIVLIAGIGAAFILSRQVVTSLERVSARLPDLVAGRTETMPHSGLREVDALAEALAGAIQGQREANQAREQAEANLRQAQKMDSLGQMTGGIAHDFNNLLQVVLASLAALKRRAKGGLASIDPAEFDRFVSAATDGAQRAGTLTQRLLAFARRQPLQPKAIDLNKLVANMSELLRRTLGEGTVIETVLGGGLWRVSVDINQTESALLNLAVNARDAMPQGGKLTIETANAFLDEAYAEAHAEVAAGQYVMLAVSDTGSGMPPEVLAKVFEPFFTTKQMGHGTGLGMSQVYGFVKQSGGHVKIYSEPGEGTTVKLYLPRHLGEGEDAPEVAIAQAPKGRQEELILLVEDEAAVREQSLAMLQELGYGVIAVGDGPAALKALEANPGIALVFTDVGLPGGMNGRQVADAALAMRPGIKVLFTTGYARNAIIHHGRLDAGLHLLTKPFTFNALAAKLREVLDQ